jgi:cob(I)alamin adenosyltransferase
VRITKVYTRKGDDGMTGLGSGQRVRKHSKRIEAYGTVDELSSFLGLAVACGLSPQVAEDLTRIQNELFDLGSDLCVPQADKERIPVSGIEPRHVEALERTIDRLQEVLGPLREFILPGGTQGAAHLHVARTVCRRAERLVVALAEEEAVGPCVVPYLNRLSDLLFVLARAENHARGQGDVFWKRT